MWRGGGAGYVRDADHAGRADAFDSPYTAAGNNGERRCDREHVRDNGADHGLGRGGRDDDQADQSDHRTGGVRGDRR